MERNCDKTDMEMPLRGGKIVILSMLKINKSIIVLGPTAVGKTSLAAELALLLNGEVISVDSRQVFRGMDIGTGKDLFEYISRGVNYHLIDVCEPDEAFDLFRFMEEYTAVFNKIIAVGKVPVLCGGTGLYLDAIIKRYRMKKIDIPDEYRKHLESLTDEELLHLLKEEKEQLHNTTDTLDRERIITALLIAKSSGEYIQLPKPEFLVTGLTLPLPDLRKNIEKRLTQRLNGGMIEETEWLLREGISHERLYFFGLEYRYISEYLQGHLNKNDMKQKLASAIYEFARKQLKWFRKMEREGVVIQWYEPARKQEVIDAAAAFLSIRQ